MLVPPMLAAAKTARMGALAAAVLSLSFPVGTAAQTSDPPQVRHATATRESLAGTYDGGQMEVAASLTLKPDGHFTYELAYGSLDEAAEGTWDVRDTVVLLTTVPTVVPPRFVVVSDKPDPRGGLWITVSNGPLMQGARQRIDLIYGPGEEPDMAEVADDGRVPIPAKRRLTAIVPEIPGYPIMVKPIPLTGAGGHRLVLRFEPHDIGKADFHPQPLAIDNGVLIMPRRDLELILHFKRQP